MGNESSTPQAPAPQTVVEDRVVEPILVDESKLLTHEDVKFLHQHLPKKQQRFEHWILLYSSTRDGLSMRTFYNEVMMRGPQFLVIRDTNGHTFGGFVTEAWDKKQAFYGSVDCFLFQIYPTRSAYHATGKINSNYIYFSFGNSTHSPIFNGLGMGGQLKHFSLALDPDFTHGTSNAGCVTYNSSPTLASDRTFQVQEIEAWGFPLDAKAEETLKNTQNMHTMIQQRARKVDPKDFVSDINILQQAGVNVGESGYFQEKADKAS